MAGHADIDGFENAGGARTTTWLRHRQAHQTDKRNLLAINQGTLYPVLLKLEQEGSIASHWGVSENNRRARFYRITKTGKKELIPEERDWQRANEIIARFVALRGEER